MRHQILHIHIYSVATRSGEPHNALHSSSIYLSMMHVRMRACVCVCMNKIMCVLMTVCSLIFLYMQLVHNDCVIINLKLKSLHDLANK